MVNNPIYLIVSDKKWNSSLISRLGIELPGKWIHIDNKKDFNKENISNLNPNKIFFPHWSHLIERSIYSKWECIVFHMTDLPFGRGGSPLQNLIIQGHSVTKVSAIKVVEEIDAGPIYLKKDLSLDGSAQTIFERTDKVIEQMIIEIVNDNLLPKEQKGEVTHFKRRTPKQSDIALLTSLEKVYNHIRMLDAEGYPKAYLEFGDFKIEFENANLASKNILEANVRIIKK